MVQPLLTIEEVADLLVVPLSTLHAWRYKGEGPPALKVGKHLRYREADVLHWLETRSRTASAR
jgi:excisionase family DNA binding protein